MKVSVCANPECAVSVCCLVDFHGLAGLLAGVRELAVEQRLLHPAILVVPLSNSQTPWKSLCNSLPGSLWIAKFYNRSRVLYECDRPIVQVSQPSKPVPHSVPSKLLSVIQHKSY